MGSTNKTAHYELPQFVANDKPSWLGDVNEAMEAIDAGIYGAKASADGAQQTANNAVAGVQSAGTRMDGIQTQLDTVATQANQTATTVTGHTSAIATNSANINTLNSRMGSTDISAIGDGTVTGAISSIAQGGGAGDFRLIDTVNVTTSSSPVQLSEDVTGKDILIVGYSSTNNPNIQRCSEILQGSKGFTICYANCNTISGSALNVLSISITGAQTANIYCGDSVVDRAKIYVRD